MDFLVDMVTTVPDGTTDAQVEAIRWRPDHPELAAQGHLLRLWRPPLRPGQWRTWGLFRAADAAELESVLSSIASRLAARHGDATNSAPQRPGQPRRHEQPGITPRGGRAGRRPHPLEGSGRRPPVAGRRRAVHGRRDLPGPASLHRLAGVAEYYAGMPMGMTAAYTLLETRALSDGLVLGYLTVDFGFTERPTLTVYLSVIIRQDADGWRIAHYQVSRLD